MSGFADCALSATLKQNAELAAKILGFFLWHDGASAVFGGGKKAKYARNTAYSDEFGEHTNRVLAQGSRAFFRCSKHRNLCGYQRIRRAEIHEILQIAWNV
jgi:hypothetical protein